MKFTSTLVLGTLVALSTAALEATVQVKGTLTFNGTTEVIMQTAEYGQEIVLNDAVSMTITECEDGICFNVQMKHVTGEETEVLRSPAFTTHLNEEVTIACGEALSISVVVEQI